MTQNGNGFNNQYVADTVEHFSALDDDEQKALKSAAYEHWIAIVFFPMCAAMGVLSMIYRPHSHVNTMSTLRLWKKQSIFWTTENLIPGLRSTLIYPIKTVLSPSRSRTSPILSRPVQLWSKIKISPDKLY